MNIRYCKPILCVLLPLGGVLISLMFYSYYAQISISNFDFKKVFDWRLSNKKIKPLIKNSSYPNKWIVITSIYKPSEAIDAFSQMSGWQVLVIGDKKTPPNWRHKNVIYLGVDDQKHLSYSILNHIPWNTYTRKMIGYLYAIQYGAEYIYESDDDNVPNQNLSLHPQSHPYRLISQTKNIVFNPYAHFGQSSIWPRGYPLDKIGVQNTNDYVICPSDRPTVVQSLVNGDPDVDAIFRLTRRQSTVKLDIRFDPKASLFLNPAGTYAPFNSQNTLFFKKTFWGMFLPTTVTDRATDIFRSYWTQRLMWLVGQRLAFGPATFYQKRNEHNLLDDLKQEYALYADIGSFIKVINSWKCSSAKFEECILSLTRVVVGAGFWKQNDFDLMEAWIADLKDIDENLLNFNIIPETNECQGSSKYSVVFHPEEQATSLNGNSKNIILPHLSRDFEIQAMMHQRCGSSIGDRWKQINLKGKTFPNTLLLISIYGDIETSLPAYEALYRFHFNKIIYCIDKDVSKSFLEKWKVTMTFLKSGELSSFGCMASAIFMNLNVNGILHLSDNMYFNITMAWRQRNFHKVWLPSEEMMPTNNDLIKLCDMKPGHCRRLTASIIDRLLKISQSPTLLSIPLETKKALGNSLIRLRQELNNLNETVIPIDIPLYFPKSEFINLYVISSIFTLRKISIEFLTQALFDLYKVEAFRLRRAIQDVENVDFDYRSNRLIATFLHNDFCRYF